MSIYIPGPPALGDVGSYQVSGKPFFRGQIIADNVIRSLEFPTVTSWIHIRNNHRQISLDGPFIAFSENGFSTNNYFQLFGSPSVNDTSPQVFHLKVTKLFYKSPTGGNLKFDVVAGLTNIPTSSIPNNWSGSAGVG